MKAFRTMIYIFCFTFICIISNAAQAAVGDIVTVAGGAIRDGSSALKANLLYPAGVAVDAAGNIYIADTGDNRIRKMTPAGAISTVAGSAKAGYGGDGGAATAASLKMPTGVALDAAGNIYIADQGNNRIRKVSGGIITTVAGNGTAGFGGDGSPATAAMLRSPFSVAVSSAGEIFIADKDNNRIRRVTSAGIISTVAGTATAGYAGDNDPATAAQLNHPSGVAVDASGQLYIADTGNNRIRKVDGKGIITLFAGDGTFSFGGDGGPATAAFINGPTGVVVAGNDVYIADRVNEAVRKVSGGIITTVAGIGKTGGNRGDGDLATKALLKHPTGIAIDSGGNIYITEQGNFLLRKVTASTGLIATIAGGGSGDFTGDAGLATAASLSYPWTVALRGADMYIADRSNNRIRKVTGATGIITTIAGGGTAGDGAATAASLSVPRGVAFNAAGDLYIADTGANKIRKVSGGVITTVAGTGMAGFSGDGGPATAATLNFPSAVALDSTGALYVADQGNNLVRRIKNGIITTVAGDDNPDDILNGTNWGYSGDKVAARGSKLYVPCGVTADSAGNIYISDMLNNRIRKVDTSGVITTVAGNGTAGYSGDAGAATAAGLWWPAAVAFDGSGNMYIADQYNFRIRKVSASGVITTLGGNGVWGYTGDNGPATAASLAYPTGLAIDSIGNLFVVDRGNKVIRKVLTSSAGVPGQPTAVLATAGNAQATVKFTAPVSNGGSPITGYKATSHPAGGVDKNAGSPLLSHVVTGLNNGTAYYFTVTASNIAGTGTASGPSNTVLPLGPPGPPLKVAAVGGNARATVSFAPPLSNGGKVIVGFTVTSIPAGGIDSNAGKSTLSHIVTGLKNGVAYTFTVKATNLLGTGVASLPSNKIVIGALPSAPLLVKATAGNARATVAFSPPGSNGGCPILGYTIVSYPAGGIDSNAGSAALSHVITGLKNGTTYYFTVKARNLIGTGPVSVASNNVIPATVPGAPIIGKAVGGNARATVSFSPPLSNGGSAIFGYTVTSNPAGGIDSNAGSALLAHTVIGLKNGTAYTFTVKAKNRIGTGAASAASNKVIPATLPGAPVMGKAVPGNARATVIFSTPASNGGSPILGYTVTSNPLGGIDSNAGSPTLSHVVTGLKNGTGYTFTVKAKNAVGTGPASLPSNKVIPTQ